METPGGIVTELFSQKLLKKRILILKYDFHAAIIEVHSLSHCRSPPFEMSSMAPQL